MNDLIDFVAGVPVWLHAAIAGALWFVVCVILGRWSRRRWVARRTVKVVGRVLRVPDNYSSMAGALTAAQDGDTIVCTMSFQDCTVTHEHDQPYVRSGQAAQARGGEVPGGPVTREELNAARKDIGRLNDWANQTNDRLAALEAKQPDRWPVIIDEGSGLIDYKLGAQPEPVVRVWHNDTVMSWGLWDGERSWSYDTGIYDAWRLDGRVKPHVYEHLVTYAGWVELTPSSKEYERVVAEWRNASKTPGPL